MSSPGEPSPAAHRPWPADDQGRLLPAVPLRGLGLDVHLTGFGPLFVRWRILACSRARFVARGGSTTEVRPASEWGAWLDERAAEGTLTAHLPGCALSWCRGCDTAWVGRPSLPPTSPTRSPRAAGPPPSRVARSPAPARSPGGSAPAAGSVPRRPALLRAGRELLARATFLPRPWSGGGEPRRCLEVRDGARAWRVSVDPGWGGPPTCTCPDHGAPGVGPFCSHVVGALLREDDLRCQLLELYL